MRLSEMLTAIREYPALKIQYEAMREQQASQERTAVQLSIAYNNLQIGNRQLSQKNKALETALAKLVPRVNSREHCRRLYKTVAPYLDPGGFVLYETAAKLNRRVVWALGLPAKAAPMTAGEIIARTVTDILNERGTKNVT